MPLARRTKREGRFYKPPVPRKYFRSPVRATRSVRRAIPFIAAPKAVGKIDVLSSLPVLGAHVDPACLAAVLIFEADVDDVTEHRAIEPEGLPYTRHPIEMFVRHLRTPA